MLPPYAFPVEEARNWGLPNGLCADREEHEPHTVQTGSLAPFVCSGDPADREPYRSEVRRAGL